MAYLCAWLFTLAPLWGQQSQTTGYTTDLNGRRVAETTIVASRTGETVRRSELTQSINGRMVPLESVEERVVREDATGRVIERVIRRFDATGNPGPPEKQRIEERRNADGSVSSVATVFRADLNGSFQLAEKVTTEASKSGNTTSAEVLIVRPTLNGSLETVERRTQTITEDPNSKKADVVTYRKDVTGRFVEALRVVTDATEQGGQRTENSAQYEPGDNGRLRVASQTVSRVRKNPDGTESREVDIYRNVPGRADPTATPRLQERQYVDVRKQGDRVIESTVVQRPSINDPNRLGAPIKLGERVCTGNGCQ